MIYVFHAQDKLMDLLANVENERVLISTVIQNIHLYQLATRVKHSELDIAFAASGGPTAWVNVDNLSVDYAPEPSRQSKFGDVLVEMANGFANLSTPAGFIPLIDVIERNGQLLKKQLN
ncbi:MULTISPECIES: hypothetical protein [Alteromonadaceae]|uniref:hypothetical protein n=1 Tax=Alteromonadaceae TaxID=72275 RepID=UPI001C0990F7|nr:MULTISPECIES: hypothetical protein [Aliiglaciecola]MBU2879517.1 hypothetical protein [Aliiglaciecola lipolytica]MDO6712562.1 hypothetical protein [Aliiglaciecola sp. 2_MG-2023]MDO6753694.1 hypothetical protein [Aliiglaciecola sp. 1_MG-2023]